MTDHEVICKLFGFAGTVPHEVRIRFLEDAYFATLLKVSIALYRENLRLEDRITSLRLVAHE